MTRQRAQEYVDNILRSMEESLLVTDTELQIRRVNPSALRLLGYREEELIGRPAAQVILEREAPARRSACVERLNVQTHGVPDGSRGGASVTPAPVFCRFCTRTPAPDEPRNLVASLGR